MVFLYIIIFIFYVNAFNTCKCSFCFCFVSFCFRGALFYFGYLLVVSVSTNHILSPLSEIFFFLKILFIYLTERETQREREHK